jgi:hypothetical protein
MMLWNFNGLKEELIKDLQKQLKDYQGNADKNIKMTQNQLGELREDFNKLKNETKEIIKKRDIWNKKESTWYENEFSKDVESIPKQNETEILEIKSSLNQIKSTVESCFGTQEKLEGRISGHKDKRDIKEK